jgi:hypothetical protein
MIKEYFALNKRKMFPYIKDWKSPQDKFRKAGVKELNYEKWFFFHPSAYALINFGVNACGMLSFGLIGVLCFFRGVFPLVGICAFVFTLLLLDLIKKMKNHHKGFTFYDLWMRES